MSEQTRVRVQDNVFSREFDGEVVIVDLHRGDYFGLDEIGSRAWGLLTEGKTLGEIATMLVGEYDVERGKLMADLFHLVSELSRRGLVEVV